MYDIITIGSASADVFVQVGGEMRKHEHHQDICYHLGDKLLIKDLLFTTGGGGTNTAVAFSRLGLKTGFLGVVGDDLNGDIILRELSLEGVHFLGRRKKGKTGYSVILSGGNDRTILVYKGVNNDLAEQDIDFRFMKAKWLYASTMLGESFQSLQKIVAYAEKQDMQIAFNPSLYLAKQGIRELGPLLKKVDALILNKEEAIALARVKNIDFALKKIASIVPGVVVVTDGPRAIRAYGGEKMYVKRIKKTKVVDATGAGDAFASGFIYGMIREKDIETALEYGHKEAVAIMQHVGAKNNLLRML